MSDIRSLYNRAVDKEDQRLEQHQLEYDITQRYFEDYIPAESKVLEIGAATGKYTMRLAARGNEVTAVDLAENLLETCKERISSSELHEHASFFVADARDLSDIPKASFDVVLLMGPMYHLVLQEDRLKVIPFSQGVWCAVMPAEAGIHS